MLAYHCPILEGGVSMRRMWLVFKTTRSMPALSYRGDPRMAGRDPVEEHSPCERPGCDGTYERNSDGKLYCGVCGGKPRSESNRK
jgi:hypothetical protein